MQLYTIGHSTHTQEEFLALLQEYKIEILVDIRRFPGSKHVPWFNQENMEKWLPDHGIQYIHLKELGGKRGKNKDIDESLIAGWENTFFRNYASYSLTDDYDKGIEGLISLSQKATLVYMCSEAVPWRCHRLFVSNTLVTEGHLVYHIMSKTKVIKHELGMYGADPEIKNHKIIYPSSPR